MDKSKAAEVGEVQEKLRQIGIDRGDGVEIAVDGVYGAETALAVSQFQRENGLPVTGKVDFKTWEALNDVYEELLERRKPPERVAAIGCNVRLSSGAVGDSVYILQVMLNAVGARFQNIGKITVDGAYSGETAAAVAEFQRAAGLPQTGAADVETFNRLATVYNNFFEQVCS